MITVITIVFQKRTAVLSNLNNTIFLNHKILFDYIIKKPSSLKHVI